jgi:hypothetical protein
MICELFESVGRFLDRATIFEMVFSYVDLLPRGRQQFPFQLSVILLFVQLVKNGAANQEPCPANSFISRSRKLRARQITSVCLAPFLCLSSDRPERKRKKLHFLDPTTRRRSHNDSWPLMTAHRSYDSLKNSTKHF